MADEYSLSKSTIPALPTTFDVLNRETRIVIDSNGSNYAGPEIIFDAGLQAISNSNKYVDWTQSEIQLPLALEYQKYNGDQTIASDSTLFMNLKNNFALMHSLRITLANQELVSYSVPFRNLACTFDIVSQLTAEQEAHALQLGIQYEPANCFTYTTAESAFGLGMCSTDVSEPYPAAAEITRDENYSYNPKRLKKLMAFNKSAATGGRFNSLLNTSVFTSQQDSYVGDQDGATVCVWIICKIPCAFMCDLLKQFPLTKNGLWTFQIQHNANTEVAISTGGTDFPSLANMTASDIRNVTFDGYSVTSAVNGQIPFQLGSAIYGGGIGVNMAGSSHPTSISCSLKIASHKWIAATSASPLPNCRMLLSLVTLRPEYESSYLRNPVKKVSYQDLVHKQLVCNAGDSFDQLVFNNVSKLRKLVMLPYSIKPSTNTVIPQNDMVSVWSGYGASYFSSPCARLSEFNVQISGSYLFPKNLNTLQEFYDQFKQTQLLNGGAHGSEEINSLISMQDYGLQYGAIVIDLSRHAQSVDPLTQTISLSFKNNTKIHLGFNCFLYYEKELYVNAETGQLVNGKDQ